MGFGTFKDNGRSSGLKLTESLQHKKINSKRHAKNCIFCLPFYIFEEYDISFNTYQF